MWEEAQEGDSNAATATATANRQPSEQTSDESQRPSAKAVKKAKKLALQGELSRAVEALEHTSVADPTRQDILTELYALHEPHAATEAEAPPMPDLPHDLDTNEKYEYKLRAIEVPGRHGQTITVDSVEWVKNRLRNNKAASLTGMRYEHIKAMPTSLLSKLTKALLNNQVPEEVRDILTSAKLIAIHKNKDTASTAIRPIAVGEAIRRFAGKVQMAQEKTHLKDLMLQVNALGVAVPGGLEYAFHATRMMLDKVDDDEVLARYDTDLNTRPASEPSAQGSGICQIDFTRAFQTFSRARAFTEIEEKSPHLLRFFVLQYYQPSQLLVTWKAACVARIWSQWGSQQGDVLGGVYFFYGTASFARQLRQICPNVLKTWIVDDLTLAGAGEELAATVDFIAEEGPRHGLLMAAKQGSKVVHSRPATGADPGDTNQWETHLCQRHGFVSQPQGLTRLLGAPLGQDDFVASQTKKHVDAKLNSVRKLRYLHDTQIEYLLLTYCYATRVTHLTRLVPPHLLTEAVEAYEKWIRPELARLADCDPESLDDLTFDLAKLPIADGGLALQDLAEMAPGAYCAAMGDVARLNADINDVAPAPPSAAIQQQLDTGDAHLRRAITTLSDKLSQGTHTINSIACPDATHVHEMPSQRRFNKPILKAKAARILDQIDTQNHRNRNSQGTNAALANETAERRKRKVWLRSQQGHGAGAQFRAIPTAPCFRAEPWVYSVMLADRLRLPIRGLQQHTCHANCQQPAGTHGDHLDHCVYGSGHTARHDKVRDVIAEMHRTLLRDRAVTTEALDLLPGAGDYRPADVAPSLYPGDNKPKALDIYIGSVVQETGWHPNKNPTLDPLKPLNDAETRKKDLDATKVIQAGLTPQQVQYEKVVLAFATTGAWGRGALAWRKDFLKAFNKVHEGAQPTMDDLDLDTNWNALSPLEYYTQRIAFSIAYHRAFLRVRRRWSTTTVTVA